MKARHAVAAIFGAVGAVAGAGSPAAAQHAHAGAPQSKTELQIPEPMRVEHEAIHARLEAATREPGAVGAAARELAAVLGPHFARENQIALPPLAVLAPLARGEAIPARLAASAQALSDTLRAELPAMLEEHVRIGAAARKLEQVARSQRDRTTEELAHDLQMHARMEEEVNYPAAVLVGALLRQR